jgi:asparagine synthase (glutamine-hydrolysing)
MCGIAGLWLRGGGLAQVLEDRIGGMMETIRHRGPDGSGRWSDAGTGVALGHLRLAIQDLSPTGAQPMASASGRYVLTYNGEIYNVGEVRRALADLGWTFRGTSDTEVFLAGLEEWGLDTVLARCAGMFAMGIWDKEERVLTLVRDRIGKKPLFVFRKDRLLLFGSELKALFSQPEVERRVEPAAAAAYLRLSHVPGTHAILQDVHKVAPGTYERHLPDGRREDVAYWSLAEVAHRGRANGFSDPHDVLVDRAEAEIDRAVRERLVSDVPVGAFLSGGIDSSLVVALMQRHTGGAARTFSIGFDDPRYDESPFAAEVARHLGTRHTTLKVTAGDALAVIPHLPDMYDEPFADSSQIPTHLVAKMARGDVTVALTGDGGDEIAGGYRRHAQITHWWPRMQAVPQGARQALAALVQSLPARTLDGLARLVASGRGPGNRVERWQKAVAVLGEPDARAIYGRLVSSWPDLRDLTDQEAAPSTHDDPQAGAGLGLLGMLRYLDMAGYLPDDVLCKVDRASMAVALEARSPLLDHRLIEWFWHLPDTSLVRGGTGKVILRDILARHVPREMFERPKTGFGIPLGAWLRGPLRDWARDLVADERPVLGAHLDFKTIAATLDDHEAGRGNHEHRLWTVLMFLAWRRRWGVSWG